VSETRGEVLFAVLIIYCIDANLRIEGGGNCDTMSGRVKLVREHFKRHVERIILHEGIIAGVVRYAFPVGVTEADVAPEEGAVVVWRARKELVMVDMANWVEEATDTCGGRYEFEFLGYSTGFEFGDTILAGLCKSNLAD
jgi:hypothetical protein